ncbi:RecX family transcriptional regulator [candidate division WOR-3 bacterium]|nr:RecX family transcriptional regulator [candidate division WOR-3 bacterium]
MKAQDERERVRTAALRLLRYRDRSIAEMRQRLSRKGFDPEVIADEIEQLIRERLLDDERFTGVWIRHKLTISHKGKRLVRAELAAKGIGAELFARVWEEHVEQERRSAETWAKAKAEDYNLLEGFERRGRIRQGLYRRGYSQEAIEEALEEIG